MYKKAQLEFGMRSAGISNARAYKSLITIWSLALHTPSHKLPRTKIRYGPVDGCFLPASLIVTGVMAVIKVGVRTTYEWDWCLARSLKKKHACIVDVRKKMLAFAMALHTLCISITASGSSPPQYFSFTKTKKDTLPNYVRPFLLAERHRLKLSRRAPKTRRKTNPWLGTSLRLKVWKKSMMASMSRCWRCSEWWYYAFYV